MEFLWGMAKNSSKDTEVWDREYVLFYGRRAPYGFAGPLTPFALTPLCMCFIKVKHIPSPCLQIHLKTTWHACGIASRPAKLLQLLSLWGKGKSPSVRPTLSVYSSHGKNANQTKPNSKKANPSSHISHMSISGTQVIKVSLILGFKFLFSLYFYIFWVKNISTLY